MSIGYIATLGGLMIALLGTERGDARSLLESVGVGMEIWR